MSRKIKSLTKIFLRVQRRLVHLQCNVKRTRWSDYVSRVDLSLSFLSSQTKNNGNIANVLIILRHFTKLHAFIGKVKNALRIIEKRCNAFHSSAVVTLLLFELRMCGAMTLISSRITSKRTVTQLAKDKTALADQYT